MPKTSQATVLPTGKGEEPSQVRPAETEFFEYRRTRNPRVRDVLVERHVGLARYLASRFTPSVAADREDLVQVALLGLIQAVEAFDPQVGVSFATFAAPTIIGVIRNYLRDHGCAVRAPRRLRELAKSVRRMSEKLEQRFGRAPTLAELAEAAGVTEERLAEAQEVDALSFGLSLDEWTAGSDSRTGGYTRAETLGREDPGFAQIEAMEAMRCLQPREQAILQRRYLHDLPQSQVAAELGISQMHVCRLERRALQRLRLHLDDAL